MAGKKQNDRVLARLKSGPLTQMEALRELGVMRLAARIGELREEHEIVTDMVTVTSRRTGEPTRVARYRLATQSIH